MSFSGGTLPTSAARIARPGLVGVKPPNFPGLSQCPAPAGRRRVLDTLVPRGLGNTGPSHREAILDTAGSSEAAFHCSRLGDENLEGIGVQEYLVCRLGFSPTCADNLQQKWPPLLDCTVEHFEENIAQLKTLDLRAHRLRRFVSKCPPALEVDLNSRVQFLKGIGLSGREIGNMYVAHPSMVVVRADELGALFDYLHHQMGLSQRQITHSCFMASPDITMLSVARIHPVVMCLEALGMGPQERAYAACGKSAAIFWRSPEKLSRDAAALREAGGLDERALAHVLNSVGPAPLLMSREAMQARMDWLRDIGFADPTARGELIAGCPGILTADSEVLQRKWDFLTQEMRAGAAAAAACPSYFNGRLLRAIGPRFHYVAQELGDVSKIMDGEQQPKLQLLAGASERAFCERLQIDHDAFHEYRLEWEETVGLDWKGIPHLV